MGNIHPTLSPEKILYTSEGFINLRELVAFDGRRAYLKNGEAIALTDGLAEGLKAYCRSFRQALDGTQPQA